MSQKTSTPVVDPDRIQHLDPQTLIVDLDSNVRVSTETDPDFLASVRELGVQEPITAVLTADGAVRVERGHRRTLAAVRTGRATVPVRITGREATTKAAQVARIVRQVDENERRAGLTVADRVKVAVQLTALDMTPGQVAKKTRRTAPEIEAALAVAGSQTAQAVAVRFDFLDMMQAAVVAEFDGDPETVKALVAAAKTGQFEHVAQQARDARAEAAAREAAAEPLRAAGLTIIDKPRWRVGPVRTLDDLKDPQTEEVLTGPAHATCPGHAAYLEEEWIDDEDDRGEGDDQADEDDGDERGRYEWRPVFVCLDPAAHGHVERWVRSMSTTDTTAEPTQEELEAQRQAKRDERRDVIASNKAWDSAETVRRTWLQSLAGRKTTPKGAAAFLAVSQATDPALLADVKGNHFAAELLGFTGHRYGLSTEVQAAVAAAASTRVQLLHLVLTVAAYEAATSRDHWRRPSPSTRRYLTYLESIGYRLSPVEERALGRRNDLGDAPDPGQDDDSGPRTDAGADTVAELERAEISVK